MATIDEFIAEAKTPRLSPWETLKRFVGRGARDEQYYLSLNDYTKRIFDIAAASALLVATGPIILLSCSAVRLTSKGKSIYVQERYGNHGWFNILKIRTMYDNVQPIYSDEGFRISPEGDNRVTRVGRILRDTHIDELPQLINVLKGDLSLIGPRARPKEEIKAMIGMHDEKAVLGFGEGQSLYMQGTNVKYILDVPQGISGFCQTYTTREYDKKEAIFYDSVLAAMYRTQWMVGWHRHFAQRTFRAAFRSDPDKQQ